MKTLMTKERQEIDKQHLWNVEALFSNQNDWEAEFNKINPVGNQSKWPQIKDFKGRLGDGPETLKKALESVLALDRKLTLLYTYAHLRHDENITDDLHKSSFSKIRGVIYDFQQEISWFDPELLSLPEETIKTYLKSPILSDYHFYIEKIFRMKKHTLSPDKEELLALAAPALQGTRQAFSALNDADFKFGKVIDGKSQEREITHGSYGVYIRDTDRTLRRNTFTLYHKKYQDFENTLCELISGLVQNHRFNARARNFESSLAAPLYAHNIDTSVYHSLIQAVHNNIDSLHRYIKLRKKILGLDTIHLYDMYIPLIPNFEFEKSYEEAEKLIIESVAPLGSEYQNILKNGLQQQRWVDRYENQNKRSGAYSSGCYDSMPYILMNYKGMLKDIFTLAHEAGHSMHSLLSRKHQPYHYADYSIFVAEVASTFNEELLMNMMLKNAKSNEEKAYLINQKIEDIRGTLFRQTMFAEFELFIHDMADKNIPLTPKLLKEEYRKLNAFYFGNETTIDAEAESEWSRIPHFYYNFYVYQYATGISAALSLAGQVLNGGEKERNAYLTLLKGGGSKYSLDLLRDAGVDMRTPKPVESAIGQFSSLVDQLEALTTKA